MIHNVGTVSLFVKDQQRAKAFYTEKLGFELFTEAPLYPGSSENWIEVGPSGTSTKIVLYEDKDGNWEHYHGVKGKSQNLTLETSDIEALHADLKDKGVEVTDVDRQPWGAFVTMTDSEGNGILITEVQAEA